MEVGNPQHIPTAPNVQASIEEAERILEFRNGIQVLLASRLHMDVEDFVNRYARAVSDILEENQDILSLYNTNREEALQQLQSKLVH
jgi:23S rRNA A2030 N6-methylase RlmJ